MNCFVNAAGCYIFPNYCSPACVLMTISPNILLTSISMEFSTVKRKTRIYYFTLSITVQIYFRNGSNDFRICNI